MISIKEQYLLEKHMKANLAREEKLILRKQISESSSRKRYNIIKHTEYINYLETRALSAWRDREKQQFCKELKEKSIQIRNSYSLQKKIMKLTNCQDLKLIRKERAKGPKTNPLPYLKKIKENVFKSLEVKEEPPPRSEVSLSSIIPLQDLALKMNPKFKYNFLVK